MRSVSFSAVAKSLKSAPMARGKLTKNSPTTLNPSFFSHLISASPFNSILSSPKKNPTNHHQVPSSSPISLFSLSLVVVFSLLVISVFSFVPILANSVQCRLLSHASMSSPMLIASLSVLLSGGVADDEPKLSGSEMVPLPLHWVVGNLSEAEMEFWKQPENGGYRPCLDFSTQYRRASAKIAKEKRRFLVVVISGGLNRQRNQIIDAVVIARILEAALVVPILQSNRIWEDESEFSEIFDIQHFKNTLKADIRVVSSLPKAHLLSTATVATQIPFNVHPLWIRAKFFKKLNEEGVLVLKGLDLKLSHNLPSDLQKLRCKVAFHALRFAAPIRELGNRLARRMWIEGPYIAIHLRLEKDAWIKTSCLPGLGSKFDEIIASDRDFQSESFFTRRSNNSHIQNRLSGLCPLNSHEIARVLKALGAARNTRIYIAGGEPFGGPNALKPLKQAFPNSITKHTLAQPLELMPFANKSSVLAAIDYIVSLSSDVYIPSHNGQMDRSMQGQRAYLGQRKYIKVEKRMVFAFFEEETLVSDEEFSTILREMHRGQLEEAEVKGKRMRGRDVISHPLQECMCKKQ